MYKERPFGRHAYSICEKCEARLDPNEECDCEKARVALYICDRRACRSCSWPQCTHTVDIQHAVNFTQTERAYVMRERLPSETHQLCIDYERTKGHDIASLVVTTRNKTDREVFVNEKAIDIHEKLISALKTEE